MKKILLALLTLISLISYSQTTGHLRYDTVKIYKVGGNSNLVIENATRDSLGFLYNYGGGRTRFEVIRAVPGGIKVGEDTIQVAVNGPDEIISGLSVSWKGTGYQFYVQEGAYRIDNQIYTSDSGSLTLAASDPTDPRKDVIYVGTDGAFHVLQGTPSPSAAEPQLDGDQIKLTVIDVPAGSTVPAFTQEIIYNENIEWTETHTSVTVDGNSATTPWIGSKNFNVTNINQGDNITFTRPIGFVSMLNYTAVSIAVNLKAILPTTANIRISFFSSGIQVSNEINLNLNKNFLGYQVQTIPTSTFTFSNYNINAVRIRYTNTAGATVHTGFYMDYIHLVAGFSQPGGGGDFNYTLVMPSGFQVSPATVQNNGTHTVTGAGSTSQYIDGTGALRTFTAWNTQGAIDGVAKTAFGFGVSGNIFYQQYVDATDPGILSAFNYRKFDSAANRVVMNGDEDTLAVYVDAFTTLIKGLKDSTGIGFAVYDDYISIYATGGGGSGLLPTTGTGTATGNVAGDLDGNSLTINDGDITLASPVTGGENSLTLNTSNTLILKSDIGADETSISLLGDIMSFASTSGIYSFINLGDNPGATKVVVWDAGSNTIGTQDISGLGGGSSLFPTTGTGTATGNVTGDLDGNTLSVQQGGVDFLSIIPTLNSESVSLRAFNTTNDNNSGYFSANTSDILAAASFIADFNDGVKRASIAASADATSSTLTHTADTHTFAGDVIANNNVLIGGTSVATSATTTLHLFNGTAPSASITDGVLLYAEDNAASSELKVRDEAGNITTLSPHNFLGIPGGKSEEMSWAFYSEKDGTYINVDMLKVVRLIEKLTGEKLVFIGKK